MSNAAILSREHAIWTAKKKRKQDQIKEVVFDDQKRSEYLTGFHKRKVERTEIKKNKAIERQKQERLELRREHRRELAERAKQNAETVEKAYRGDVSDDGSEQDTAKNKRGAAAQMEFEDEEQLATVTVVDDFSQDDIVAFSRPQPLPSVRDGQPTQSSISKARKSAEETKREVKVKEKIKYRTPKFIPKAKKPARINHKSRVEEEPRQRKNRGEKRPSRGGRRR